MNPRTKNLLYSSNIWAFGNGMLGPLFAVFAQRVGGNVLSISWAWAVYLIVTGLLIMLIGDISDSRTNKERTMLAGYGLSALFTFGYLTVHSTASLFVVQAGLGVATALMKPTWEALYAKHENRRRAGLAWGLAGGESNLMTGIALLIGGLIVNYISFKFLFMTMGVILSIATIYQAKILILESKQD